MIDPDRLAVPQGHGREASRLRLKVLGCESLAGMLAGCEALSRHRLDMQLLEIGLHDQPGRLRSHLQGHIDACEGGGYDALLLAYGLCGLGLAGLEARDTPIVIPRAHDCITILLGGRGRYEEEFESHPGTYWYTRELIERRAQNRPTLSLGWASHANDPDLWKEYVEKYGQEQAEYLWQVLSAWLDHYDRAVYLDQGDAHEAEAEALVRAEAARRGWTFERMKADPDLLCRLMNGAWDEDFLILQPSQRLVMTYDQGIIGALPEG